MVSGGYENMTAAAAGWESVNGGEHNTASGAFSTVGGGGGSSAGITESDTRGFAAGSLAATPTVPVYEAH